MAKMACRCGHVFRFDVETKEHELSLFPWTFIENTTDKFDEGKLSADDFYSSCVASSRDVHPCSECGRIYIETKERSGVFDVYVKEDSGGS
jgi:hypothetical protein